MIKEVIKSRNEEIRVEYINGVPTREIAERYNMTMRNVQAIIKNNGWRLPKKDRVKNKIVKNNKKVINQKRKKKAIKQEEKKKEIYVYLIRFEDKNVYIGQTQNIKSRMSVHMSKAITGTHRSEYINSITQKYGREYIKEKFLKPEILYVNLKGTRAEALGKEKFYQMKYIKEGYTILGGLLF